MKSLLVKQFRCINLQCHFQTIRHCSKIANTNINININVNANTNEFSMPRGLSNDEKEFLNENGYLCIKNFVSKKITSNLRKRMMKLLTDFDESSTKSVFASHRNEKQYKDTYFLNSGNKICYFWEQNVFDDSGKLNREKQYAINKVGHSLHTLDSYFNSYVYGYLPKLVKDIGFKKPIALQSMYICKQPGVGGEVSKHQDTTFLMTKPHSCYGIWLAIDKTDKQNGCVVVSPKSHKTAKLRNRFKRISNEETTMVPLIGDGSFHDFKTEDGIPVECNSGDLLILHGEVVHWSEANTSNVPRHALMIHCVDGAYEYLSDNWLQYPKGESFPQFTDHDLKNQIQNSQLIANADL